MDPISSNPLSFQAARAYGLPARPVTPAKAVAPAERAIPIDKTGAGRTAEAGGAAKLWRADGGSKANPGVASLVAAKVPGSIDFSGAEPTPGKSLSIYRNPAEQNVAATGVSAGRSSGPSSGLNAGRVLDVTG